MVGYYLKKWCSNTCQLIIHTRSDSSDGHISMFLPYNSSFGIFIFSLVGVIKCMASLKNINRLEISVVILLGDWRLLWISCHENMIEYIEAVLQNDWSRVILFLTWLSKSPFNYFLFRFCKSYFHSNTIAIFSYNKT